MEVSISKVSKSVLDDIVCGCAEYDAAYERQFGIQFDLFADPCKGCPVSEYCDRDMCLWGDDEDEEL